MSSATPTATATNENSAPQSTILGPIERQHLEIKAKIAELAKKYSTHTTTTVTKPTLINPSTSQSAPSTVKPPVTTAQNAIPKMQRPRRTRDGYTPLVKLLY